MCIHELQYIKLCGKNPSNQSPTSSRSILWGKGDNRRSSIMSFEDKGRIDGSGTQKKGKNPCSLTSRSLRYHRSYQISTSRYYNITFNSSKEMGIQAHLKCARFLYMMAAIPTPPTTYTTHTY